MASVTCLHPFPPHGKAVQVVVLVGQSFCRLPRLASLNKNPLMSGVSWNTPYLERPRSEYCLPCVRRLTCLISIECCPNRASNSFFNPDSVCMPLGHTWIELVEDHSLFDLIERGRRVNPVLYRSRTHGARNQL